MIEEVSSCAVDGQPSGSTYIAQACNSSQTADLPRFHTGLLLHNSCSMLQKLFSYFLMPKPTSGKPSQPVAAGATIAECQQQLLHQLKSGNHALSSSDKEGYRTLCYYRGAFLFVSVGDDGTSVLRLPQEDVLLNYLWRQNSSKIVLEAGQYTWSYDLTEAEKLEKWQEILARLSPFTEASQQFVARVLAEFASLSAPQ